MKKRLSFLFISCIVLFSANSQITIDGTVSDWNNLPILSEPGVFPMAKVVNDGVNLSFLVNLGPTETFNPSAWNIVDLYLDADFNATTGYKQWAYVSSGMDYLSQGSDFYKFSGTDGTDSWSWSVVGSIAGRQVSVDAHSIEQSIAISSLTSPALGSQYAVGLPYYNSEYTSGDPTLFPQNHWDFPQRKGFVVKSRTEVTLSTTADFTSTNAYYHPFMKDENIAQYLDFQSAVWAAQNQLHWASWALDLASPGKYVLKMTSQCTGSGKAQLVLVNMATNNVVKTFSEVWYPADGVMTENTYGEIDLSDVPAGKYMLKLTNPTAWDTFLKVQKITLTKTATSLNLIDSEKFNICNINNKLEINSLELMDVSIYNTTGQIISQKYQTKNARFDLANNIYIVIINQNGEVYSRKIVKP